MLNYNGEITLPCFTSFNSEKESEYFIMPSDITFCMLIHNNTIVLQFLNTHCEPITIQKVFHTKPYQKLWMD